MSRRIVASHAGRKDDLALPAEHRPPNAIDQRHDGRAMDVQRPHDLVLHPRVADRVQDCLIDSEREGVPSAIFNIVPHVRRQAVREKVDVLTAWLGVLGEKVADGKFDFVLRK